VEQVAVQQATPAFPQLASLAQVMEQNSFPSRSAAQVSLLTVQVVPEHPAWLLPSFALQT
jgi:hypothetical protein